MIKKTLIISFISTILFSCTKDGNKGVLKESPVNEVETVADNGQPDQNIGYNIDINGNKTVKTDYVYQASDKTLVKVKFDYTPGKGSVSIINNKKTFTLDKISSDGTQTIYEKADMKVRVQGDSLILKQGNTIIELVKTKI